MGNRLLLFSFALRVVDLCLDRILMNLLKFWIHVDLFDPGIQIIGGGIVDGHREFTRQRPLDGGDWCW